ncbi:MAG: tetratricopeptide repeat protein [Planctomycetes bacterium]|nr:tetratricopeptide repeat protein [Planctomycetota bacterium]
MEEGLADLERAIAAFPERFEALFHRARGLWLVGRREEALRELDVALKARPDFRPARAFRAQILGEKGTQGGEGTGEGAAAEGWARAWLGAHQAAKERRCREVVEACGELLAFHGRGGREPYPGCHIESFLGRGIASLELKDFKAAQRDFVAAWTLGSGFLEPPLLLGKAYYLEGSRNDAERVFADLYRGAESTDEAALWIANVYRSPGDRERGLEWAACVGDGLLRERLRAECLGGLGRHGDAIRAWRREALEVSRTGVGSEGIDAHERRADMRRSNAGRAAVAGSLVLGLGGLCPVQAPGVSAEGGTDCAVPLDRCGVLPYTPIK